LGGGGREGRKKIEKFTKRVYLYEFPFIRSELFGWTIAHRWIGRVSGKGVIRVLGEKGKRKKERKEGERDKDKTKRLSSMCDATGLFVG